MAIQFHAVLCLEAQRKGMVITMEETEIIETKKSEKKKTGINATVNPVLAWSILAVAFAIAIIAGVVCCL